MIFKAIHNYNFVSYCSPLFVQSETASLLIIQCDSGHLNGDLIASARYRIYDMRAKALINKSQRTHATHVLFIIHLPVQTVQPTFVGFQGDPWISCHIDELRPSEKGLFTLEGAQGVSISRLFYGGQEENEAQIPELERQTSDFSSNEDGMVFEHESAEGDEEVDEMEEELSESEIEEDIAVMDIENEEATESSASSRESSTSSQIEEPMENKGPEPLENKDPQSDESDIIERKGHLRPSMPFSDGVQGPQLVSWKTGTFPKMYPQCVRLHSCIQAAASRLPDNQNKERAAERVKLLIELIPCEPVFPLGMAITIYISPCSVYYTSLI